MIKNKSLLVTLFACVCIVAAVSVRANLPESSTKLSKIDLRANKAATSSSVVAERVDLKTKSGESPAKKYNNPFAGRKHHQTNTGQPMSEFLAEHRAYTTTETSDLLPGMAEQIRDDQNPLDIACNIVQGNTAASGFVNAQEGYEFAGWINPGPSCAGTPDFPYRVDSVSFTIANAAAFGITGTAGAGTAVYRVNIFATSNCSSDSCANPGVALCNSQFISYTTANTSGALATLTVPVGCCVSGPFFASIEYVSWTGPGDNNGTNGAFRSLWPSLLWSSSTITRPACEQWVFNGCSWSDHGSFFTAPNGGYYYFTVYGESNAGCTPVTCATEQVCDITCPGGATPEGEPTCANEYVDVTNGGCFAVAENFGSISCGETVCGTSGTFTVAGANSSDDDFYEFTLTQTTDVSFSVTAEFCVLAAIFQAGPTGFECDSATVLGSAVESACSTLTLSGRLEAGTYYAYVTTALLTGVTCGAQYYASLDCEIVTCIPDFSASVSCAGAVPAITGTTVGAGDPCGIGIESELWELTVTAAGSYNFIGCGGPEAYDQFLYLFDETNCCVAFSAADDDLCGDVGGLSYIRCVDLTPGTYFLLVSGFSAGDVGQYSIAVECCQPCPIECTDNEFEQDCGPEFVGSNDGCNADPVQFEVINCGDTKCGSWGYYTRNDSGFRDLDWYKISLTEDTRLTVTATAEVENDLWITTDCPATTIQFSTTYDCSTHTVSACVAAGDYYIITAPSQGLDSAPCGSKYMLSLTCEPCAIVDACPDDAAFTQVVTHPDSNWTFGVSDVQGGLKRYESFTLPTGVTGIDQISFWGIVTQAVGFDLCTEDPMTFSIQFWADNAGAPDINAGPVCDITTTIAANGSNLIYSDVYEALSYTYTWPTGTCCELTEGWVSIQGTSTGSPDNCRFLWGSSGNSDLGESLLYTDGVPQTPETFDLAMCLSPCPGPCNPINDLAVTLAPGNGAAWLKFTAPQDANYLIYSTINPNADDNPDNGGDPNYTLEATVPLTAGSQTWTAPAGFSTFKKYVVVADCGQ
ncbi:MAG: hypothetical protein KDB65_10985 [Calditrichaeota bacterium]|nr:hypothetical protein [Calditrichota bacterium]